MKKLLLLILTFFTVGLTVSHAQAINDFRSVASTNWSLNTTWERWNGTIWAVPAVGTWPGSAANNGNVTIRNGHTVTVAAAPAGAISSLTVGEGTTGILNVGAFAFTVTGTTTIASGGTLSITGATAKTFTGDFTNNGTWNNTAANCPINFTGNITNNGTFNAGATAVYTLNAGAARALNGTMTFASITQSVTGGVYTNNGTLTVSTLHTITLGSFVNSGTYSTAGLSMAGAFTNNSTATITGTTFSGTSTFTNAANSTLNWTSTGAGPTTLTATANPNTVLYNNTASGQTVKATTYWNLNIDKTAQTGTVAVFTANTLNIISGTLSTSSNAATVNGATNISSAGTFTGTGGAKAFTGDVTVDGTYNNSSTATMAGNLIVNSGSTFTAGGVHTFSGTTKTISGTATSISIPSTTVTGTYTNNIATFNVATALIGAGTLTMGTNTQLNIGGTSTITTLACTTNTPNTVSYNGTTGQTVKLTTYHNLDVNKSLNVATLAAGTTTVNNNLSVTQGTLADLTTASITMSGGTFSVADGAVYRTVKSSGVNYFPASYGTLNFNTTGGFEYAASAPYNIPTTPTTTYGKLIISTGGTKTLQTPTTVYSLDISASTLADGGNQITGNAGGTFVMGASGGLTLGLSTSATSFPTGFTNGNITFNTSSTVTYNSTGSQTISSVPTYANLALASGSGVVKALNGNTTVTTNVNIGASNTLDIDDKILTVTGTTAFTISGTGFLDADNASSRVRLNITTGVQTFTAAPARLINGYIANLDIYSSGAGSTSLSAGTQVTNLTVNTSGVFTLGTNTLSISGAIANSGSIASLAGGTLEFNGTSGVQTISLGTLTGSPYARLAVNNSSGVTLGAAALVGGLDFTSGVLNTTGTNILTIYTASGAVGTVTGATSTTYVNGPMRRQFNGAFATAGTYVFPVGKSGSLNSFALTNPTSGSTATVQAEVINSNSGGSGGPGFTNLATNRYWQTSVTSGTLTGVGNIVLTESGLSNPLTAIGQNTGGSANLTYSLIGGTLGSGIITSELTPATALGFFVIGDRVPLSVTVDVGPGSTDGIFNLSTAASGLFQAINTRGLSGNLVARIIGNITTEDGAIALNEWNEFGGSNYTLTIRADASTARTISGSYTGATSNVSGLIRLNGADRVTISGGTGAQRLLTIRNTYTTGSNFVSAIGFHNSSTNNTVTDVILEAGNSGTLTTNNCGVVHFSAASSGTGNDNNTIDKCDVREITTPTANYPRFGVYSIGASGFTNDGNTINACNIINFYVSTTQYAGVWLTDYNTTWQITNNHLYQTVTRTSGTSTEGAGIRIQNGSADVIATGNTGHFIKGNKIGGTGRDGSGNITGTWTENGAVTNRFRGIAVGQASGAVATVRNNIISNFSFNTTSGQSTSFGIFGGIYVFGAGNAIVNSNTIGSATTAGAITITCPTNGAIVWGIRSTSTSTTAASVDSNTVAGIVYTGGTGTANTGITLEGINITSASYTVSTNTIGNATAPLTISSNSTSNATAVRGINIAGSASYSYTVSGNAISGLTSTISGAGTGGATQVAGIITSSGAQYQINNNIISDLTSAAANTGTGTSASILGISLSTANTQQCSINGNTIFNLANTYSSTANVTVSGIVYTGGTSTSNTISNNKVHSLNNGGTSTTTPFAQLYGINIISGSGIATVANNMVRLGIKADGSDVTNHLNIVGIADASTSAHNVYFNSVYIGGTASTGTLTANVSTYAMLRSATGTDLIKNNIFANDRTGGTGTTSYHIAFGSTSATNLTAANYDYNVYYSRDNEETANAGTPYTGATTALRMQVLRGTAPIGSNLHSGIASLAQINFKNATGNAAAVNLEVNNNTCAANAAVTGTGIGTDYTGTNSRSGTAPAMGAFEPGTLTALSSNPNYDIYTPNFSFTNIANQALCVGGSTITVDVTITDVGTAVPTSGSVPVMWWWRSAPTTGTWVPTSGVLQSGNGNSGVWRFTITPTLSGGETYQYYFVADDQATNTSNSNSVNRWYSSYNTTTPVVNLTTQTTAPATLTSFTVTGTTPLTGVVTVGTSGTYATFNGSTSSAFFYDLAQKGMSGNLTVKVISDVNELANYYPLTQWSEYCGTGYTLLIRPDTNVLRTVASNTSGANPLIEMTGVKRVTIDGSNAGSGRYLRFRQMSTQSLMPPAIYFNSNAQNITIKNVTIEGNNSQLTSSTAIGAGVINFASSLGSGTDMRNITLDNNIIRNRSDLTQSAVNTPISLIQIGQANGVSGLVKSRIVITNNELFNFQESAIHVSQNSLGNGIGDSIIITGNKVYMPISMPTYTYPIWLEGGTNSDGNVISNNIIGGNAAPNPGLNGTWTNTLSDGEIVAIFTLNGGTTPSTGTTISGNTIGNMSVTGTGFTNLIGIRNEYGATTIKKNTITTMANNGGGSALDVTYTTANIGIWNQDDNESLIDSNTVTTWTTPGITQRYLFMVGIMNGSNFYLNGIDYSNFPAGKVTLTNNVVSNLYCGSGLQSLLVSPDALIGIYSFSENGTIGNIVSNNRVSGLRATLTNAYNIRVYGIGVGLGGYGATNTGTVSNNKVYDLNNTGGGANIEINGITIAGGNWTVSNNMVSITNSVYPTIYPSIVGIYDWMESGRTGAFYNNSVYIGGTVASPGVNSSYAYLRLPDGLGDVWGANIKLRNNVFFNDRTGNITNNIAIGNLTQGNSSDAAVGWDANYNFLTARDANMIGRWIGTPANNKTFANWLTASGGDGNSWSVAAAASSSNTQVLASDIFNNTSTGDLTIKTSHQASWFVNGKGVAGSQVGSLATDLGGTSRSTTYGYGMDIGADEFAPDGGIVPHVLTGTPSLGGTNTFTFAGRTVASVVWGGSGTAPSAVSCQYYSGNDPGTSPCPTYIGTNKANFVYEIYVSGGSGYSYTANLNYDPAVLGNYATAESTTRLVKTSPSNNWFDQHASINTTTKVLTSVGTLNSFSWFTGGEANTPLPIELLTFTAVPNNDMVDLGWVTATEINNDYFTVERSLDGINFEAVAIVAGAGNSNTTLHYTAIDDLPHTGLSYYRLKQTDYNGDFAYSQIVPVMFDSDEFTVVNSFVNAGGDFEVWVNTPDNGKADVSIMDISGKLISTTAKLFGKGMNTVILPANGLSAGIYFIRVQTLQNTKTIKVLYKN